MHIVETARNRDDERRIITAFASKYGCTKIDFTPDYYPLDALIEKNGKRWGFAEARKRHCSVDAFPDLMWSLQKHIHAREHAFYLPSFLVIEWDEGIYWTRIKNEPLEVAFMHREGKKSFRNERDNEVCVQIPISHFKRLAIDDIQKQSA